MQRTNPASRQQVLTPEDIRVIRARSEAAAAARIPPVVAKVLTPGAFGAIAGPPRTKRDLDAKSAATQDSLKAAAAVKRARKATRLAKEVAR